MKKFISGLIVGLLITSGVYAAGTIKSASFNADTKIQINGEIVPMEMVAVVLEGQTDGKNYVGVRRLAEAMGGVVGYIDNTKTITIDTATGEPDAVSTSTEKITQTPDGINVNFWNDEYYIDIGAITSMQQRIHKETSSTVSYSLVSVTIPYEEDYEVARLYKYTYEMYKSTLVEKSKELILDNIELYAIPDRLHVFIKYDYYVDTIMPLMK